MNRLPELKSFLKDGEAEWYEGVEVQYIHGRKAVMTVFEDGEEKEKITLSDMKTKPEMHTMMIEKGFVKKSEEEIAEMKKKIEEAKTEEEERRRKMREERQKKAEERRKQKEEDAAKKEAEDEAAKVETAGAKAEL